jgi:hypothetical protein
MYSHERSLVKRYKNRPFVLLGVNTDDSREQLKKAMVDNDLSWRSWFDGPPGGPITSAWGIQAFPTIYLLDAKGIIRYYNPPGAQLDQAIEKLIAEAPEAS